MDEASAVTKVDYSKDYVPMKLFGKDHWSTFAYIETCLVDKKGFSVGLDPRMRTKRRHFRVFGEQAGEAFQTKKGASRYAAPCLSTDYPTRLNDGTEVTDHDDWDCVQDMAAAGLFTVTSEDIDPGVQLKFSELGYTVAAQLRKYKAEDGNFATFVFDPNS